MLHHEQPLNIPSEADDRYFSGRLPIEHVDATPEPQIDFNEYVHRKTRSDLEDLLAPTELSLKEGGVLDGLRKAAQAELDARNQKSRSGGNFQAGLLKGKDVPVREIEDNMPNMSGNPDALTHKEFPPEDKSNEAAPKEASRPERPAPIFYRRKNITPPNPIPSMEGKLYSDAPKTYPYALWHKAAEKGKDDKGNRNFLGGIDYLSTEEIQDMVNYATGPDRAADFTKARDAAYIDSQTYASMHMRRRGHINDATTDEYAAKARQSKARADYHHRLAGDIFNTEDRNLLSPRDLKVLQQELRDRQAADAYIEKQFDSLAKSQEGVDTTLQMLQFLGLEKSPKKLLNWKVSMGNIGVGPAAAAQAYDWRALQIIRDNPAVSEYIFEHSASHDVYDRLKTHAGKELFLDFYHPYAHEMSERMSRRLHAEEQARKQAA